MPNNNCHEERVLCRSGARDLKEEEFNLVSGGVVTTHVCTHNPTTGRDGDCD
jgi:hypothetical protein